jgi:protease-4
VPVNGDLYFSSQKVPTGRRDVFRDSLAGVRFLLRLAYNILRLITWPLWGLIPRFRRKANAWVSLRILERLSTRFWPTHLSVLEIEQLVSELLRDPNAKGLLLTLGSIRGGWATLESTRETLAKLPAAGKRLVIALPQGADQRELWLASAGDRVCASEPAAFTALGPAAQRPYLTGLLAKLGVEVQVFAQGDYKTAAESVSRERMSDPEREQLSALLATIQGRWVEDVSSRAQVGPEHAARALEQAMFGPHEAKELGLVDHVCYADELETELDLQKQPAQNRRRYLRVRRRRLFVPLKRPSKVVALVRLQGAIGSAPNPRGISLAATLAMLRRLREDTRVAGVILHIDSPGGSAVVSDLLHREICRLDASKPVVAWMGNVAASGGYYLAAAARSIVARPTTVTGSIGVISARPVASELMSRVGIRSEVVKLAPHADLHSLRAADAREVSLIEAETKRYYERFLDVVAQGRKRSRAEIEPLAGGRVWSGADAHRHGLVDQLGGYAEARATLDAILATQPFRVAVEPELVEPEVSSSASEHIVAGLLARVTLRSEDNQAWLALRALVLTGDRVLALALPCEFT